jgi:hypothetical protein
MLIKYGRVHYPLYQVLYLCFKYCRTGLKIKRMSEIFDLLFSKKKFSYGAFDL